MLQNTSKTLGFQKIMVYKTPPGVGGGGKPYLARGLQISRKVIQKNFSGSNAGGLFTAAVSNSFLSPCEKSHSCRFGII